MRVSQPVALALSSRICRIDDSLRGFETRRMQLVPGHGTTGGIRSSRGRVRTGREDAELVDGNWQALRAHRDRWLHAHPRNPSKELGNLRARRPSRVVEEVVVRGPHDRSSNLACQALQPNCCN